MAAKGVERVGSDFVSSCEIVSRPAAKKSMEDRPLETARNQIKINSVFSVSSVVFSYGTTESTESHRKSQMHSWELLKETQRRMSNAICGE